MSAYDWGRFTTRIAINAPIEKLYWCWATRAGMEYWFLRMSEFRTNDATVRKDEEFIGEGDTYRWRWHGWDDSVEEKDRILSVNGKDMIKFGFGKAGVCTVNIKSNPGENIVELLQENIPVDEEGKHLWHVGCKTGWSFYLVNMKSLLEGGIDLRNKDVHLTNVVNA